MVACHCLRFSDSPPATFVHKRLQMSNWIKSYNTTIASFPRSIFSYHQHLLPMKLCKDVCEIIRQYHDRSVFDVLHERLIGIERYEFELNLHGEDYFARMANDFALFCNMPMVRSFVFVFYHLHQSDERLKFFETMIPTREEAQTWHPLLVTFWTAVIQMDYPLLSYCSLRGSYDLAVLHPSPSPPNLLVFVKNGGLRFRMDERLNFLFP